MRSGGEEAKFWLDPIDVAANHGFNGRELGIVEDLVEFHRQELLEAWNEHFG